MASDPLAGLDFDPYEVLGAAHDATPKDLKMAYRKKALELHPDKNPQRKTWAESKFQQLSRAFELLSDEAAKGAYDRLLRAKEAAKARTRKLDSKRRKLKEDLEAREAGVKSEAEEESAAMRKLEAEIARLRKQSRKAQRLGKSVIVVMQGSAMVAKEREEVEREVKEEVRKATEDRANAEPARLKAKWERKDTYDREDLLKLFEAYGVVAHLIMSGKGKSALIEFATADAAALAVRRETGIQGDPIELSWVSGRPSDAPTWNAEPPPSAGPIPAPVPVPPFAPAPSRPSNFEDIVLQRLAEAQKRKQLLKQEQDL